MKRGTVVVLVLALLAVGYLFWTDGWIIVNDPLVRADAIAVLNGDYPARAHEAAALFKAGWAPEVWLTQDRGSFSDALQPPIRDAGTDSNCRMLKTKRIPLDATVVFQLPAEGTLGEIEQIAGELQHRGGAVVILITSTYHTRRVKLLWRAVVGDHPKAIVHIARESARQDLTKEKLKAAYAVLVWAKQSLGLRSPARRAEPVTNC